MTTELYNGTILTPTEVIPHGAVLVSDEGKIVYAGPEATVPYHGQPCIDARGAFVAPGFIDIHVHGGNGINFAAYDGVAQGLQRYSQWVVTTGVTGFLCSVAAADGEALLRLVEAYAKALSSPMPGAEALGLHLEGPFLNPAKKGAFSAAWLRPPSVQETEALLRAGRGWIRQVTLASELPGALEVAAQFRAAGVVVALGHSDTDYQQATAALQGDFTHVTHTFNAQRAFAHREPGVCGAVLASEKVTAEIIADMVHVHPAAIRILLRCLGTDRVVLITDALAAAGLSDGIYDLVGERVIVSGGRATLVVDGNLAGSTATMNQCVRNMIYPVGVPIWDAVKMASLNPARAMGLSDRLGSLEVGKDASLVVVDDEVRVHLAMVRGRIVHCAEKV